MIFEEIYEAYWGKIYRLCMGYVNDAEWAKDIAQETFITVWQQLPKFRNESAIGTWIFKIASNNCLRQIEKNNRMPAGEIPTQMMDKAEPSMEENIRLLYKYISELNETDRIIILLELEDIKQNEIATIVGLSETNIRVKVHRIKEKLLKKFKQNEQ
ncbi:MAG: sigma-70 family RNA polymerase sigma factor [Flavipsychrobacter sp.]|nr:sigma-70 family RNA polymerase sigma factor [Flavipsychrobacter sp.]